MNSTCTKHLPRRRYCIRPQQKIVPSRGDNQEEFGVYFEMRVTGEYPSINIIIVPCSLALGSGALAWVFVPLIAENGLQPNRQSSLEIQQGCPAKTIAQTSYVNINPVYFQGHGEIVERFVSWQVGERRQHKRQLRMRSEVDLRVRSTFENGVIFRTQWKILTKRRKSAIPIDCY